MPIRIKVQREQLKMRWSKKQLPALCDSPALSVFSRSWTPNHSTDQSVVLVVSNDDLLD